MQVLCAAKPTTPATGGRSMPPTAGPLSGRLAALAPQQWRTKAFSLYTGETPEPTGPFSFWPRPNEAGKAKAPAPAKKAAKPAAEDLADEAGQPQSVLGKQRFRSALEQVSYYTNQSAFNRE